MKKSEARRGVCPRCGFRFRLTRKGVLGTHWLYLQSFKDWCPGSGMLPKSEKP